MTRPIESDYTSQVAYTRALEAYCDSLAQPEQELGFAEPEKFNKGGWHPITEIKCHYGNYYARLK